MTSPRQGLFLPSRSISGELARRGSKSSSLASTNISPSLLSNSFVCILPPMQRPVTDPPALPPPHDEQLFEIFQTFATDGLVHVDQIPTILTLRDEKYSAAEIDRAVHATTLSVGGGGCLLPYDQVLAVWQTLSVPGSEDTTPRCDQKTPVPPSWWPGYGCLRTRRQHSLTLGVRSKPTNWLLCVTLVMTVVVAAIITGLATAFLWRFSIEQEIQTLQREMNIVRDAVESIGVRLNEDSHSWKILFATRLMQGNIIGVAYNATANRFLDGVGMAQQVVRGQLEEEWRQLVRQDLTLGVQDTVNWLAALNASAAPLVDALNQQSAARDITLGRWADARRTAITVLTAHNVSGQCADATAWPCGLARHRLALLRGALEASTGSASTTDPALTAPQGYVAAWGRLPDGTALVYALSAAAVQARFAEQQTTATAAGFAALNGTLRVLLTRLDANGTLQVTGPSVPGCPGWQSWPPLTRALNETAQQWGVDPCGADEVLVAYGPVPSLGLGLVVYRNASAGRAAVTAALAGTFEQLNQDPTREEKLFLVEPNSPRDGCVRCLTPSVCVDECDGDPPNGSAPSVALQIALMPEEGLVTGSDRYGVLYTAGHDRLPALGLCFAVGISEEDTQAEGLRLVLTYIERQNNLTNTSQEILMAKAVAGVRQADIDGPEDFRYLTSLRFSSQCQSLRCGEGLDAAAPILRALQGESGVTLGDDYRPVLVISAYTYLPALQAALELKVDASEAEQPSITVASRLALLCVEAAACCLVALAFIIKAIVAWIEKVWAEGQRTVRDQRQQLLTFLDRMYPASVARDLILTRPRCGGMISFMVAVPHASVVFADIHGFTSTCHRLTAQQLMTFLGYTFSVMDVVASRAGMCRVKLVGDCYMAVAGLPGSADTPCRSAVFFATWCAQVFSDRYTHPLQNQATMDGLAALACNKGPWPDPWRTDSTTTSEVALGEVKCRPWWNPQAMTLAGHGTPCVLRYGIATGRVTAGVLPGNTPILDVWGKVVTFANQMERLSQPGRVLLCSQTYKSVTADDVASHAFTFEDGPPLPARPSPSAAATSHFVRSARGLPPCLVAELGLSPVAYDAAGPPPPDPTTSADPSSPADDAPLVLLTEASSGT